MAIHLTSIFKRSIPRYIQRAEIAREKNPIDPWTALHCFLQVKNTDREQKGIIVNTNLIKITAIGPASHTSGVELGHAVIKYFGSVTTGSEINIFLTNLTEDYDKLSEASVVIEAKNKTINPLFSFSFAIKERTIDFRYIESHQPSLGGKLIAALYNTALDLGVTKINWRIINNNPNAEQFLTHLEFGRQIDPTTKSWEELIK